MNRKVYLFALLLILAAAASISAKVVHGGHTVSSEYSRHLWRISMTMNITGKGSRAKVRLTLPRDNARQTIYNEHFENDEMVFYVRERSDTNRIGFWRSELLDGRKTLQYTFSAQLKSLMYDIPKDAHLSVEPFKTYPVDFHRWLEPSEFIQSKDVIIRRHLKKAIGREKNTAAVIRKLFDFVRGQVRYRSEKGSKDAKETLKKLTADCGGQARLFCALSRAAGIPSRLAGSIILTGGTKNTTHVWVENYVAGKWIPFDVVNDHYASIPNHYLELYRGDYYLFKYVGLSKFEYFFFIDVENMPPVDNRWSLYALPIHFQAFAKVLLLIPMGALVVAFCRSVIGVPTYGTFGPILLALAFQEISLQMGIFFLSVVVLTGWVLRKILDHLKILVIPRMAIILTMVVIAVLAMMVVGSYFGAKNIFYISLFPMIIITWIIERFSVTQSEDGTLAAFQTSLGTIAVAAAVYYVIRMHAVRIYLFAFPEILLIIMALLLVLGRYTGIRLMELWRFRELNRLKGKTSL